MSSWGCPHDLNGQCQRVPGRPCEPGMKGCILFGRFTFADESKNISRRIKGDAPPSSTGPSGKPDGD